MCLPATCSGIDWNFEEPDDWPRLHRAYNERMREEIALALREIPADDLVIQWDVAWEFVDMAIGDKRLFAFFPQLTAEDKFQRYAAPARRPVAGHPRRDAARLPLVLRHLGRLADGRDG